MSIPLINDPAAQTVHQNPSEAELRAVAEEVEVSFLAEMLKHTGFGEARSQFGGGAGEAQFTSMLRNEHARAIVNAGGIGLNAGGIGLAETIFESLVNRASGMDRGQGQ